MKTSAEDERGPARNPTLLPPDRVRSTSDITIGADIGAVSGPSREPPARPMNAVALLYLQATAGNHAVKGLLAPRSSTATRFTPASYSSAADTAMSSPATIHSPMVSVPMSHPASMDTPVPIQAVTNPAADTKKEVSAKGRERLELAQDAIDHTRQVLEFGAGNQLDALNTTGANSYFRMRVVRGNGYWEIAPAVQELAKNNRDALEAAKTEMVQGGNCREYSRVALNYLRVNAKGETLNLAQCDTPDHVFVVIGKRRTDPEANLATADPWPTRPTACLFEDHFMYPHHKKFNWIHASVADGQNVKDVILAGLKLTKEGEETARKTPNEMEYKAIMKMLRRKNYLWDQRKSTLPEHDFKYVPRQED